MTELDQNSDASFVTQPLIDILVLAPEQYPMINDEALARELSIKVRTADTIDQATKVWRAHRAKIIILPVHLSGESTLPFVQNCLAKDPDLQPIVIVNRDQINEAAEAMRAGIVNCLFRPFSTERFKRALSDVLHQLNSEHGDPAKPNHDRGPSTPRAVPPKPEKTTRHPPKPNPLIGSDPAVNKLRTAINSIEGKTDPVLLVGPDGSGKAYCAQLIYTQMKSDSTFFNCIDCTRVQLNALPTKPINLPGHFTHYFDEICDLTSDVQAGLARMISERTFDNIRLIGATKHDPETAIHAGLLRRDFYSLIRAIEIKVPSIQDRVQSFPELAREKLTQVSEGEGSSLRDFEDAALAALTAYPWPGNIRQLFNTLRAIVVKHGKSNHISHISIDMVPAFILSGDPQILENHGQQDSAANPAIRAGLTLAEMERIAIETAIEAEDSNMIRAAKRLDVAPSTLYRKRQSWKTS